MNEGALTLTTDKLILYANQAFARMVKFPLERVDRRFPAALSLLRRPWARRFDRS